MRFGRGSFSSRARCTSGAAPESSNIALRLRVLGMVLVDLFGEPHPSYYYADHVEDDVRQVHKSQHATTPPLGISQVAVVAEADVHGDRQEDTDTGDEHAARRLTVGGYTERYTCR